MASLSGDEIAIVAAAAAPARAFELWVHLCDKPKPTRYIEDLAVASARVYPASVSEHTRQRFRSVCGIVANDAAARGDAAAVLRWMHLARERVSDKHLLYDNNIHWAAYTLSKHPDEIAFSDDALAVYRWCEHSMRDCDQDDMGVMHFACLLVRPHAGADWDAFAATRIASRTPWKALCAAETRAQMIEAIWDWLDAVQTYQIGAHSIMRRVLDRRFPRTSME